jgi:hypothetical protein
VWPPMARISSPTRTGSVTEAKCLDRRPWDLEIRRRVVPCAPRGDCVAEDPARRGADPVGGLMPAACLDAPQRAEQFLRRYGGHRLAAQVRGYSALLSREPSPRPA